MRNKYLKISLFALSFMFFTSAMAQEINNLSLKEAIALAKKQNTSMRNATYDLEIARQQVWETTTQGLPQANANLSYTNNIDLPVTLVPAKIFNPAAADGEFMELSFGVQHNTQFQFQVTQLVFNGSYIVGLQTAKTFKRMSQENYDKTEMDVVKGTIQSYNNLLFALENKKILERNLKDMEQTFFEISKTHEAGLVEKSAVDQIELNATTMRNALENMNRQIETQYNLLKIQMGINISDSLALKDSLRGIFAQTQVEKSILQKFDINNNADYKLFKTQEEISKQSLNLEKSKLLPSINAFYSYNQSGQADKLSDLKWFPSAMVGAQLVIPITTSGGTLSKIKQAQLELRKTQNNRSLMEQNLLMSAKNARNSLVSAYETYLTEEKNVKLAAHIYKETLAKFKKGTASSAELTQINTQFINGQSKLYSAMLNVLNAKAELDNILGNKL